MSDDINKIINDKINLPNNRVGLMYELYVIMIKFIFGVIKSTQKYIIFLVFD